MAVWYEMEKTEKGIKNFLDSNWGFHDFRIEKIEYIPGKDCVEIFLKYDSEWLGGCVTLLLENNLIIWLDDDSWGSQTGEHLNEMKEHTTWAEAERIFWAVTDENGHPVEMPQNRIHQIGNTYGKIEEKDFELQAFHGGSPP